MVLKGNMSATAAEDELKGSVAADKNEILFSRFGINYNNEPEMFKKGSVVYREYALEEPGKQTLEEVGSEAGVMHTSERPLSKTQADKMRKARAKANVVVRHVDIIKDEFWEKRPWILSGKPGRPVESITASQHES